MASNEIYRYGEEPTHLSLRERLRQSRLEKAVAREAARAKEIASAQTPISPVISEEVFGVNDNCRNCDAASQTEFSVSPSSVRIEFSQSLSERIANAGNRELRDLVVKLIARCSGAREVAEDYFRENGLRDDESEEGDAGDGEEDQREEDEEPAISARKRSGSSVLRLQVLEDSQESIHRDELDLNSACPSPQLSDDSRDLGYISGGDNSTSGTVVHNVGVAQPSSISGRRSEDYREEGLEFIPRDDSNFDTTNDLRATQLSANDEARPEHSVGIVQASNHSLSDGYNFLDVPAASVTTTSLKDAEINVSSLESSHEPSESQAFSKEIENECEKPIPEEKSRNAHTTPWLALILAEPENCPCDVINNRYIDIQKDHESERDIGSKTSDLHALPDNQTIGGSVQEDGLVSREGGSVSPENGPVNHSGNFTPDLEDRGSVDASSENGTLICATASKSYTDIGTQRMEGGLPIVDAISEHSIPIPAPTSNSHNDIHTEHAEEGPQTVDEVGGGITAIPLQYSESHSDMDTECINKDQAHQVIIIDSNLDQDEEETESGLIPSSNYICETCRKPCAPLQGHTINVANTQATTCLHCIARAAYQQATGCPTLRFRLDDSIRGESPACSRLSTPLPSARPSVESLSRLGTPSQSEPIAEKDFGIAGMDATSQTPQSNSASPKVVGQEEPIPPQEDVVIETYIKGNQLVNGFQADIVNQSSTGIQPTEECRFNERDKDTIIVELPANFDSELSNSRWRKRKRHTKLDDTGSLEDSVSSPIPPKRRRGRPLKSFRVDTELLPQNPISPSLPLPNSKRRRGRPPGSKNRSKLGTWPDQGRSDVSMDRCTADIETNPQSRISTSHAFNADGPEGTPEKFHESADITYPTASTPPQSPHTGPLPQLICSLRSSSPIQPPAPILSQASVHHQNHISPSSSSSPIQLPAPKPHPPPILPPASKPHPAPILPPASKHHPPPIQPPASKPRPPPIQPPASKPHPAPILPPAAKPHPAPILPPAAKPHPAPILPPASKPHPPPILPPTSSTTATPHQSAEQTHQNRNSKLTSSSLQGTSLISTHAPIATSPSDPHTSPSTRTSLDPHLFFTHSFGSYALSSQPKNTFFAHSFDPHAPTSAAQPPSKPAQSIIGRRNSSAKQSRINPLVGV